MFGVILGLYAEFIGDPAAGLANRRGVGIYPTYPLIWSGGNMRRRLGMVLAWRVGGINIAWRRNGIRLACQSMAGIA